MNNGLYLCRPGGDIIGSMSGLDENSVSLTRQVNAPWDLTFEVYRYLNEGNDIWGETTYYRSISEGMELFLDTECVKARFRITSEPSIASDGINEHKSIEAKSIECELQNKTLKSFKINTGESDSLENLVMGNIFGEAVDINDTTQKIYNYNFNPYFNLPVEYIRVYNDLLERLTNDYVFTSNSIYVRNLDVTISYSVNPMSGVVTALNLSQQPILLEVMTDFIKNFKRIQQDIKWVIDDNNLLGDINPPTDKVVCIVESYLLIDEDNNVKLQMPQFLYELKEDGYHITSKVETYNFSPERLLEGIANIKNYYAEFGNQLSVLDLALENVKLSGWSVGTISENLDKSRPTFNIDTQDIYSFLTNTFASYKKIIVDFDRYHKKVNLIDVQSDDVEHDTGVMIGFHNLMNSIDVKSSSDSGLVTKFNVSGGEDLNILFANFGTNSILDLDYFMSKIDEYGNRQFVTDELYQHYQNWKNYRDNEIITLRGVPIWEIDEKYKQLNWELPNNLTWEDIKYTVTSKDELYNKPDKRLGDYGFYELSDAAGEICQYVKEDGEYIWLEVYSIERGDTTLLSGTRREIYQKLSEKYNQAIIDIDRVINLVPNDGVRVDYTTFSYDELEKVWTAYTNAFNILINLYKEDYGADVVVPDSLWFNIADRVPENEVKGYKRTSSGELVEVTSILSTMYCHDFSSYYYNIIPNVLQALKKYISTDETLEVINTTPEGDWIRIETGNPYYESNPDALDGLTTEAYKYDMSLYGRDELNILKRSWIAAASKLYKIDYIKSGDSIENYTFNAWDDLADVEDEDVPSQKHFMSQEDYEEKLSDYLDYVSRVERPNKLVSVGLYGKTYAKVGDVYRKRCKGVIFMAQDEISKSELLIEQLESYRDTLYNMRKEISDSVVLERWSEFSDNELGIINSLITEADFNNPNILTTNLSALGISINGEETVTEVQKELLEDAQKKLFEKSRPQYSFTANVDNLLAIPEFQPLFSSIDLLNYIYLRIGLYDNETIRLRIISIQSNPIINDDQITLEFTNMLYTYNGINDLTHLFEELMGGESSGGSVSSGSGSGGGTYGTNDADITISNNMLNALLKNREYISSLNDNIAEAKRIITDSLYAGSVVIGGYATDGELQNGLEVTAETLTTNYRAEIKNEKDRAEGAETTLNSRITQTAESISSEVSRATNAEDNLSSRITQTAESISLSANKSSWDTSAYIDRRIIKYCVSSISELPSDAKVNDWALNVSNGEIYKCTAVNSWTKQGTAKRIDTAASIVAAVNDSESSVMISADKIAMSGTTYFLKSGDDISMLVNDSDYQTATNVANSITQAQRDNAYQGVCTTHDTTSRNIGMYLVSCKNFVLEKGAAVSIYFQYASNSNYKKLLVYAPTPDPTPLPDAKDIYFNGEKVGGSNELHWSAGSTLTFVYDGSHWNYVDSPNNYSTSCSSSATSSEKDITLNNYIIQKGTTMSVLMTYDNTSLLARFRINNLIINTIAYNNYGYSPTTDNGYGWIAGEMVDFIFDGAIWRIKVPATIINGDHITTGVITSKNGINKIDLNNSTFHLGSVASSDNYIDWDGTKFTIAGTLASASSLKFDDSNNTSIAGEDGTWRWKWKTANTIVNRIIDYPTFSYFSFEFNCTTSDVVLEALVYTDASEEEVLGGDDYNLYKFYDQYIQGFAVNSFTYDITPILFRFKYYEGVDASGFNFKRYGLSTVKVDALDIETKYIIQGLIFRIK